MKAVVCAKYGLPEIQEVDRPAVSEHSVLVRVHAASVNPIDWYSLMGRPYAFRMMTGPLKPKRFVLGYDFAGTVESVGGKVEQLRPGEQVFGTVTGALAEAVCAAEDHAAPIPANLTFEQAAAVPLAALTALQALRDGGKVQPGQRVLINGASGGVGTFAVQIAKSFGAEVTGVCSTQHVELVRSIGADEIIDYTQEDFTRGRQRYDVMLDIAGSRPWSDCKRVLTSEATVVVIGGPKTNRWIGPVGHMLGMRLASAGGSRRVIVFMTKMHKPDLLVLRELLNARRVRPVVDRRYEFGEVGEAFRYLGEGHAKGKVVIAL